MAGVLNGIEDQSQVLRNSHDVFPVRLRNLKSVLIFVMIFVILLEDSSLVAIALTVTARVCMPALPPIEAILFLYHLMDNSLPSALSFMSSNKLT